MLNFNEFQEHIKNTILDYLPEEFSDAKVDLQQVAKNYVQYRESKWCSGNY